MRHIDDYAIDTTVSAPEYFLGAGVCGTAWESCYVGAADTEYEAIEHALDLACQDDWFIDDLVNNGDDTDTAPGDLQYYAVLYVS